MMRSVALNRASQALVVFVGLCTSIAFSDEPEWVVKRPIVQGYYVGIGMAQKNRPPAEYTEAARNIALNDIASQITVSVSSDVLRTVLEKNQQLEEEFQSRIRASATADLEAVQLVDTYESEDGYWVYCRLSKADYEARRAQKLNAAATQSLDLYSGGKKHEREGRTGQALGLYAQAFGPIERYLAEPLVVQSEGRSVYLVNEIYNSLRTLLDRIEVRATNPEQDAKIGRPLKKPLELTALLRDSVSLPAAQLPFRFAFTRGSGVYVDRVQTDKQGIARCQVQKITATDRIQVIEANLDLLALASGESTPPVVRTVLGSFAPPGTRFMLNVSGVDVFVDADESMFGEPLQQKRIEPVVKSELGARDFSFVDTRSKASLLVSIKADTRKGTESYGLAFAFASATVSVLDLETGQEIYKSSIADVKEGSDSFEKAASKGLNTLAQRIARDMVPQLVEKVQR
jgi:hypothetical protein